MPQTSDNNVFFLHVFIEKSMKLINLLSHGSRSHKTHGSTDYLKETWWLLFVYLFFLRATEYYHSRKPPVCFQTVIYHSMNKPSIKDT